MNVLNKQSQAAISALEYAIKAIKTYSKHDVIDGYRRMTDDIHALTTTMCHNYLADNSDTEEQVYSLALSKSTAVALAQALMSMIGIARSDSITYDAGIAGMTERKGNTVLTARCHEVGCGEIYELSLLFNGNYKCTNDDCDNSVSDDEYYGIAICKTCTDNLSFQDREAIKIEKEL